jgi:hypothetical protein
MTPLAGTRRSRAILLSVLAVMVLSVASAPLTRADSVSASWGAYTYTMRHTPTGQGCFESTYPDTTWHQVPCSTRDVGPAQVGNGVDESANAGSSTLITYADGSFDSVSGITNEVDSKQSANYYSLQVNSNDNFTCTPPSGNTWSDCWEQFIYVSGGTCSTCGFVEIQYWLIGYYATYSACPGPSHPNTAAWQSYQSTDCWTYAGGTTAPGEALASNLDKESLSGTSNMGLDGYDQATWCLPGTGCYSYSNTDSVFKLYNGWHVAEFNVFGYADASQANIIGSSISVTVHDNEESGGGTTVTPTCDNVGYTGETNNLTITSNSCTVLSNSTMKFTEG